MLSDSIHGQTYNPTIHVTTPTIHDTTPTIHGLTKSALKNLDSYVYIIRAIWDSLGEFRRPRLVEVLSASFIGGEATDDLHGYGALVSGAVGGASYGVAKKAKLISVKVLSGSGSGTTSGAISEVTGGNRPGISYLSCSLNWSFLQYSYS
ncbi:hypothetical protein K7432_015956 [Basidiobolus ranarum]|uniref:Uncharacterized protein n=1 Tax=Basidiobolus ranarum TaxID=34480 RepID=A0ABR2VMA3_9FUNG